MSIRTTIKKHYNFVRESGSFGFSVMIHICLFIVFFFITFTAQQSPQPPVPPKHGPVYKPVADTPEPTRTPPRDMSQVPVTTRATDKPRVAQKQDPRIATRPRIKTDFTIPALAPGERNKASMPNVVKIGTAMRQEFRKKYKEFFEAGNNGRKARIDNLVVVQYHGGDWDCEFIGSPAYGSIPNLIHEIEARTEIEIVNKTPVVVRADSPEIMKSPFVYFTGHQNFTLTEAEVENLRTYLLRGYAIVANSSLPGRRSRFDVAFRREMKRVVPDHDLTPVGKDHGIFHTAFSFERVPVGMNYYAEPIEVVTVNDHVGVIYNLNDYGDLMLARLNDDGKAIKYGDRVDYVKDDKGKLKPVVTGVRWEGPRVYSQHHSGRNLYAGCDNPETVRNAFLFNINILTYLLAR